MFEEDDVLVICAATVVLLNTVNVASINGRKRYGKMDFMEDLIKIYCR